MINITDALLLIQSEVFIPQKIHVNIGDARNYILADDIAADRDYPPFNRAAVDGFAVASADLESGRKSFHIHSEIYAGQEYDTHSPLTSGECVKIMTGAAVPEGLNIIFKVEDCSIAGRIIQIPETKFSAGMNISARGENSVCGSVLLRKGQRIDERTVHSLAAVGISSVPVYKPPVVSIISTGDEIVAVDSQPRAHQIRDSNYYGLSCQLEKFNIKPAGYAIVNDDKAQLAASIAKALESDLVLISGGVSMGDADYIPGILADLGVDEIFHNVKIKPGKPLWFGRRREARGEGIASKTTPVVFALPGNPLSTLVSYKIFVEPWLSRVMKTASPSKIYLPLLQDRSLHGNRPEYFPARLSRDPETGVTAVEPLKFHGSGDISAGNTSDGLAFHPLEFSTLKKGDVVEFQPWSIL